MSPTAPANLGQHAPEAPPRSITPAAARRGWHEPRVHFWWIVAIVLVVAAACLAVRQLWARSSDLRLIKTGTRVDEALIWLVGARVKGRPIGEQDGVIVEFKFNGQDQVIRGRRLSGWTDGILTGEPRAIYVDPKDPTNYTARTTPPPMGRLLIGPLLLCGIAAVLLVLSVIKRRGVLAIWRSGEAREAAVIETKQTAMAPRSRLVRCTLASGADRRVIDVHVPHRVGNPQPGETIWIIMPPGKPEKAVAAVSFV